MLQLLQYGAKDGRMREFHDTKQGPNWHKMTTPDRSRTDESGGHFAGIGYMIQKIQHSKSSHGTGK